MRRKKRKKLPEKKKKFKFKSTERFLQPDPRHNNLVLSKLVNKLMWDGKKSTAQEVVYDCLGLLKRRVKDSEPLDVLLTAINNVKPHIEVRSKRVGGATYQVPMEVTRKRQQTLAIRVVVDNARNKKGKPIAQCLADELYDAYNRQGASIMWRENVHKMAEANKLFAHFAW